MQMRTVVRFSLSTVFNLLNNNIRQALVSAFAQFSDNAEYFVLDICNIRFNSRRRDYRNSPLAQIRGNKRGIFIIFNEVRKTVFCVASSEDQDFYPINCGSRNSGVVKYINGQNPRIKKFKLNRRMTWTKRVYRRYINRHSILFLCLKPAPNATMNFKDALERLKADLESILTSLNLKPLI